MTRNNLIAEDGEETLRRRSWLKAWLPARSRMLNALQLRFEPVPDADQPVALPEESVLHASMRQGMGLIIAAALIAGALPFFYTWYTAARLGTAAPIAQLGQWADLGNVPGLQVLGVDKVLAETAATAAGLKPAFFPGWLAAGITALGQWINWPLRWLGIWIVYGLGVLVIAKLLGATTTLQQFYTLSSFAFLPLILTGLGFIPCVGIVANIVALLWALAVYVVAVRAATKLSTGLAVLATLLPAAMAALLSMVLAFSVASAIVSAFVR